MCGQCAGTCEEEVAEAWGAAGLPLEDPPLMPPPYALSCQNMKIRLKQADPPPPPPTPTHPPAPLRLCDATFSASAPVTACICCGLFVTASELRPLS